MMELIDNIFLILLRKEGVVCLLIAAFFLFIFSLLSLYFHFQRMKKKFTPRER